MQEKKLVWNLNQAPYYFHEMRAFLSDNKAFDGEKTSCQNQQLPDWVKSPSSNERWRERGKNQINFLTAPLYYIQPTNVRNVNVLVKFYLTVHTSSTSVRFFIRKTRKGWSRFSCEIFMKILIAYRPIEWPHIHTRTYREFISVL